MTGGDLVTSATIMTFPECYDMSERFWRISTVSIARTYRKSLQFFNDLDSMSSRCRFDVLELESRSVDRLGTLDRVFGVRSSPGLSLSLGQ